MVNGVNMEYSTSFPPKLQILATTYVHLLTTFVNVLVLTDSWMMAVPQV